MDHLKDGLKNLTMGVRPEDVERMIQEAERMLIEIKTRGEFTSTNITVHIELTKAIDGVWAENDKFLGQVFQ